jgi:hypothetical protein
MGGPKLSAARLLFCLKPVRKLLKGFNRSLDQQRNILLMLLPFYP